MTAQQVLTRFRVVGFILVCISVLITRFVLIDGWPIKTTRRVIRSITRHPTQTNPVVGKDLESFVENTAYYWKTHPRVMLWSCTEARRNTSSSENQWDKKWQGMFHIKEEHQFLKRQCFFYKNVPWVRNNRELLCSYIWIPIRIFD